jgi:dUTP pyrophosphatase
MSDLEVQLMRLPHSEGLRLPTRATANSSGMDIYAAVKGDTVIRPNSWEMIPTGFSIAIPEGYEAQICPRSGLAYTYGITVLNSPGTIDSDYRGEVCVILMNHSSKEFSVTRGMRIAQMKIVPVIRVKWEEVTSLDSTERGDGGFGSTGSS